jgi:hypothetical protein
MKWGLILLMTMLAAACAGSRLPGAKAETPGFTPSQFVKSDIDRIAEAQQRELLASLKLLTEKLYKRNPREWKKGGWAALDGPVERLFGKPHNWHFPELEGRFGADAVQLAFKLDYGGDRVFAFIAGLGGMVLAAFDNRYEFFMTDDLDAQRLYNAARNIEIAAWKLAHDRGANGELLLLSNEAGPTPNLSFEREFGKMIGGLDTLSSTIADKNNRTIVKVVQNLATAVFLPVSVLR